MFLRIQRVQAVDDAERERQRPFECVIGRGFSRDLRDDVAMVLCRGWRRESERYTKKYIFHAAPQSFRTLSVQFALRCVGSFSAPTGAHRFDQNATKSPFNRWFDR
jgi:hypothetical protein